MEAFVEDRLDLGILYGTDGGPVFRTTIIPAASGREDRNINWSEEGGAWELGDRQMLRSTLRYIIGFFRKRRGRAVGFRWKNWADYILDTQTIATADGILTDFQITKTESDGLGTDYVRRIRKPVAGTVNVYFGTTQQMSGWTVDTTTGIITFTTPPPDLTDIRCSCEYDLPVRFNTDHLPMRFDALRASDSEAAYYLPPLPIILDKSQ
ncbi:TIGR02217 family protein [bacterium endosymbiont of Escarpia laminata]|nr:MAG: TIGR02217 family protein [bacterium endosymbiont of Escarpia laminata]